MYSSIYKKGLHTYLYPEYARFDRAWYNYVQTHFAHVRTTLSLQVNTQIYDTFRTWKQIYSHCLTDFSEEQFAIQNTQTILFSEQFIYLL